MSKINVSRLLETLSLHTYFAETPFLPLLSVKFLTLEFICYLFSRQFFTCIRFINCNSVHTQTYFPIIQYNLPYFIEFLAINLFHLNL